MKFNIAKADTIASTTIDGITYRYGWYHSGRAYIAKEDELLTFRQAKIELVPKTPYGYYDSFFCKENGQYYKKTIDGIVRYMIERHNG